MKKVLAAVLVCGAVCLCCGITSFLSRMDEGISSYSASMREGDRPGEVEVNFQVQTGRRAGTIGAASIAIYRADGSYVETIGGTLVNGLIERDARYKSETYPYEGASGVSYYAKVKLTVAINGETDNRILMTNTVQAR